MIGFMSTGMRHILRGHKHRLVSTYSIAHVYTSVHASCLCCNFQCFATLPGRGPWSATSCNPSRKRGAAKCPGRPTRQTNTRIHTHIDIDIHEKPLMACQGVDVTMCTSTGNPWMPFQNLQPAKTSTKSQPATRPPSGSSALHSLWIAKARTTPPASAPQWCRCHQIKRQGWLNSKITGEENQHQGADRWLPIHLPLTLIRLYLIHITQTQKGSLFSFSFKVTNYSQQETSDKIIHPKSL